MATVTVGIPETTFVSSAQPDNNFAAYPLLFTGTDTAFQNCISLLKLSLTSLPVNHIDSAILQLSVIVKNGSEPSPVLVNEITEAYNTSDVTYTTLPAFISTAVQVNITTQDIYTSVNFDITSLVNQWLSGAVPNNGIALTNSDGITVVQFATNNIVYEPYFPKLTITYSESPIIDSAVNFSYAQLANLISQLITFYPSNVITVFTRGLVASSVTGTPYQLYISSQGTFGAIFILMDNGQQEAIPLTAITAIYTGAGSIYNPGITYLQPPDFEPGYDTDLITAYYEYLPVSTTGVTMYLGSNITASGDIYKNEYGILVLSDADGNTPIFVPVNNINVTLPIFQPPALNSLAGTKLAITVQT